MRLAATLCFLLLKVCITAGAQTLLLSGDPSGALDLAAVRTFSGTVEAQAVRVEPSSDVIVCLLMDTLAEGELVSIRATITALYKAVGRTRALSMVLLSSGTFQTAGPFKRAAELEAALGELRQVAQPDVTAAGASFYWTLAASTANVGTANWASLVLIGHPPPVDPKIEDYVAAYLLRTLSSRRVRVSLWGVGAASPPFLASICWLTGGSVLGGGLVLPTPVPDAPVQTYYEVSWPSPKIARGFQLYRAALLRRAGSTILDIPWLVVAPEAELPGPERYLNSRDLSEEANGLLRNVELTEAQTERLRSGLQEVLSVNPSDRTGLRLAVDFYRRYRDNRTAARFLSWLMELEPDRTDLLADYGHLSLLTGDLDAAEQALQEARRLEQSSPVLAEDLARIRIARNDLVGALPYLEESLASSPKNLELLRIRADLSRKTGDWARLADSLEKALNLDARDLAERTELVTVYLAHDLKEEALHHIQAVMADPPPDASARITYASFLEQLGRPDDALLAWRKTLEVDPSHEQAHYTVSRLLSERGDLEASMSAAEAGLVAIPSSARLHLLRVEILERQGAIREVRKTLRRAAATIEDVSLLRRRAEVEDLFGPSAPGAYRSSAEAAAREGLSTEDRLSLLRRGLTVSLREGERDTAAWFASQLAGLGREEYTAWLGGERASSSNGTWVPGGVAALMFMAQGKERSSRQAAISDYCRAVLVRILGRQGEALEAYKRALLDHFERLRALEALGKREGSLLRIELSVTQREGQRAAERVLSLLGWRLRVSGNTVQVTPGEEQSQAKRQESLSALGVDAVAMQEALQSWKPHTIEIAYEQADIILGEEAWRSAFYPRENLAGGFLEAVLRDPRIAQLYVGLTAMDPATLAILNEGIGLKRLAERYATLLHLYASALSVVDQHVVVPGGRAAEAAWRRLVGASADQPARFMRALFEKDDGSALAYFLTLSQLDIPRQRFFTCNEARLGRFYELFRRSLDLRVGPDRLVRETSFLEFLRDIPLDSGGKVRFPGGPEVWMVARGQSNSEAATGRLLKKLAKVASPDEEDEILLLLARTRYETGTARYTELDNFIAVARIDGHREAPLEEAAALRLAQRFADYESVYPYFTVLTGLTDNELQRFFTLADRLRQLEGTTLNTIMGQFHSLLAVLSLAQQSRAVSPAGAAKLFRSLCERFGAARVPADFTNASLDVTREILTGIAVDLRDPDPDKAMWELLLGNQRPVAVEVGDAVLNLDPAATRREEYGRVIEQQKVTSLRALFSIQTAARSLAEASNPAIEQIKVIEQELPQLLVVPVPKELGVSGKLREDLESYQPRRLAEILARLRSEVSKRKVNPRQVSSLTARLLEEISPQVKVALSGVVYAYYLRPDDLVVSDDPLLLRKHQFIPLERRNNDESAFVASDLHVSDSKLGSYFLGGFATFSQPVGKAATSTGRGGGATDFVAMSQLGTLRASDWSLLQDQDLRLFALTVAAAREWIVQAAGVPRLHNDLSEDTFGLLSLSRRADLLHALPVRDWTSVWEAVTLSDLYFLGVRFLTRYDKDPFESPVVRELRRVVALPRTGGLLSLGASRPELLGCSHPHLTVIGPYEEFERHLFPARVAERVAEFKLYLAQLADRTGVPAAVLGLAAERLVGDVLKQMSMADERDWRSALAAFSAVSEDQLIEALSRQ